jgi:ABC-2 type transport system ATP-binding protein
MLAMIHRTGTEFGIAIILASHLLGEIERVCDFLVAIEGGRLLQAAPLRSFTQRTGVVRVQSDDGPAPLASRLAEGGLQVRVDGQDVLVVVEDEAIYDRIRDAAVDLGVGLARIEPVRRSLEDLFRDAPDAGPVAATDTRVGS